ncbi:MULTISPECIES: glycoside hydrolase family 30 beta sandwich domain-containing protein [unclassified Clostridium]|uniref:glycoside hydrolase family 30 protein n=1 Tax=unclassified Clostridium TaxID=2614128 RepID=UPI00029816E7|nr:MULTISPECIES: glycoside hydrolase family 30 beta sandwich domain-containing protein [unclassified Clostridium]EKQ55572.1 MAG: O-glycosyl hydrolase [Clostridium sp. Maddingley MBC34-26]
MRKIKHIYSSDKIYWQEGQIQNAEYEDTLEITDETKQIVKGFGGCFNEISWDVLKRIDESSRNEILDNLFTEKGLNLNIGRLPIGASDYALEWHSYDETDEDYELKDFSIKRDEEYLLPYLKEALIRKPNMSLFASPWSPPTWMKTKKVYNYGTLCWEKENLDAYANYFVKYVKAYEKAGIKIEQIHIQNEPHADQKFPSCMWTGKEMRDFIKNHLGPVFEEKGIDTEIWLGTINGPFVDFQLPGYGAPFSQFYDQCVNTVLSDKEARKYITGAGFQWGGKHVIEQVALSYPEVRLMQTENECGDGKNTWTHAEYVFGLFWHYFTHNVESYSYWNMVLPKGGVSTWGWEQNTMITIDPETKEVVYEPEFYVMKHFSHFVKPEAKRIVTTGHWTSNSIVFKNPNGELVAIVGNAMDSEREFTFKYKDTSFSTIIKSHSVNTFYVQA